MWGVRCSWRWGLILTRSDRRSSSSSQVTQVAGRDPRSIVRPWPGSGVGLVPCSWGPAYPHPIRARSVAETSGTSGDMSQAMIEDAKELHPYLIEARARHPSVRSSIRVERIRFTNPDKAEVRFAVVFGVGQGIKFEGWAFRHGDRWLVTRETVALLLAPGGVVVPPKSE